MLSGRVACTGESSRLALPFEQKPKPPGTDKLQSCGANTNKSTLADIISRLRRLESARSSKNTMHTTGTLRCRMARTRACVLCRDLHPWKYHVLDGSFQQSIGQEGWQIDETIHHYLPPTNVLHVMMGVASQTRRNAVLPDKKAMKGDSTRALNGARWRPGGLVQPQTGHMWWQRGTARNILLVARW